VAEQTSTSESNSRPATPGTTLSLTSRPNTCAYADVYERFLDDLDLTVEDWLAEASAYGVGPSVMQVEVDGRSITS
jgi:hypothetical protein